MRYLGLSDIQKRWGIYGGEYTRQGIAYLMKSDSFPEPAIVANEGRTRLWSISDILDFEEAHPEVLDEQLKRAKVASYWKCNRLKRHGKMTGA